MRELAKLSEEVGQVALFVAPVLVILGELIDKIDFFFF